MRILQISAAYPPALGGVSTHVANLAHGLLKIADDNFVSVITKSSTKATYLPHASGRLQIWKFSATDVPNYDGRRAPFQDFVKFLLDNWRRNISADIIHAHDFDSAYLGWMLKTAFDVPMLLTIHRAPVEWRKNKYKDNPKDCFLEASKAHSIADVVAVPSEVSKDVLLDQGFNPNKVVCIPHGIDQKYLASICNLPFIDSIKPNKNARLILCPSRADEHKDPDTFIRAASILKRKNRKQKLVFLMTAQPTILYRLVDVAHSLGLSVGKGKDIIFEEFGFKQMPTLYRSASVCVVPSIRESFGQTILEAFLFKAPVVASNRAALNEIIDHEENGLLFTPGSAEDLAQQVQRILDDEQLANALIEHALVSLKDEYDCIEMSEEYLELYDLMINRN